MSRTNTRFFSSFGWSLVGATLLAISLSPLGLYPIAWIALIPLLSRWELRGPSWAYARELYAVVLVASCFSGFWLLFHPDTGLAIQGGLGLFLVPIPIVVAFLSASVVKTRWGLPRGLATLVANVLAFEYLALHSSIQAPWLLLGHTQAEATLFNQTADLGGVLLLSAWVLALNVAAFFVLPRTAKLPTTWAARWALFSTQRVGARGLALAAFFVLVAMSTAYGTYRLDKLDAVSGYLRVGLVQPNMTPKAWADPGDKSRVAYLASMSNQILQVWNGSRYRPDSSSVMLSVSSSSPDRAAGPSGLLIWPQGALPHLGSPDRQLELVQRLESWSVRMNVGLLAGAETLNPERQETLPTTVFLSPDRQLDAASGEDEASRPAIMSSRGRAYDLGQTRVASVQGFQSLYGDHVRDVSSDADVLVVLAETDEWGHSPGVYQHLAYTKLRAIESRRAVIVSTVRGVSALVQPDGESDRVAEWKDQGVVSLDVPIHQQHTLYTRWGDWVGMLGLVLAGIGNVALVVKGGYRPAPPARARTPRI